MSRASSAGKPKCDEFEEEVMAECVSLVDDNSCPKRKRVSSSLSSITNYYSYAHVKKCAAIVMQKNYWDDKTRSFVKKWQLNRTTSRLCFTNKWVHGVLRRHLLKKTSLPESSQSGAYVESQDDDAKKHDTISSESFSSSATSSVVKTDDTHEFDHHDDVEIDMSDMTDFLDNCFGFDFDCSI